MSSKIALIISGALRNYETGKLAHHIWGDVDKHVVTWESTSSDLDGYASSIGAKSATAVQDKNFLLESKHRHNGFRMVYLWSHAISMFKNDYDKLIIIRPDAFHWTENINEIRNQIEQCYSVTTNTNTNPENKYLLSDHVVIVDKTFFHRIEELFLRCTTIYDSCKDRKPDIHELLNLVLGDIPGIKNDAVARCVETVFIRNTFKALSSDEYNYVLYRSIFYDSASWWRREKRSRYHGGLRPEHCCE